MIITKKNELTYKMQEFIDSIGNIQTICFVDVKTLYSLKTLYKYTLYVAISNNYFDEEVNKPIMVELPCYLHQDFNDIVVYILPACYIKESLYEPVEIITRCWLWN